MNSPPALASAIFSPPVPLYIVPWLGGPPIAEVFGGQIIHHPELKVVSTGRQVNVDIVGTI
jgi:hypothetical protein